MPEKDGNIDAHSVPIKSIHSNVAQIFIEITEDKLKIILNEYKDTQIDSKSWVAPLGIFIALVTTLTTSTSNDFLLPKEYWGSVYVGGALIAFFFPPLLSQPQFRPLNQGSQAVEEASRRTVFE